MKNMRKRFIAATLAGCLSVGSTIGAFAVSRTPSPIEDGDQRRIIASFVHGSEYVNSGGTDGAGYNFAMSGLPNGGSVKAGNFIKLYALDPSVNVTNNTVGATIEGDSLYCLCPNQPVNVNYGTGYLATAHTESALDGDLSPYLPVPLTEHGVDILRKAVAVTYVASINLKWQYVAHHGQNEWVEFEYPRADYPETGEQTMQDITENKIACQILVWMAAMGWLDENNPEYEKTALDIFLKEMYAKYPDEAANIEALYWRYKADYESLGKTYNDIVGLYGIEDYMKQNPNGYTPAYYDGSYSVFEIPVTSKEIEDHFDITRAIEESLRKQGLNSPDYSVRYKENNKKIIVVKISTAVPQNSFEIEVNTTHLQGNSAYASKYFKELVILDGGTQQNLVSLTPKTGTFKLVREAAPIEMKLVKTFEGVSAADAGIDTSKFAFVLWDAGKKRFLNFDSKGGVYTHNGTTARDSNSATQLLLNTRGEIKLDNIPSGGDYYFRETRALANWSKMLDQWVPFEPDKDGTFTFDNHGEGTGLLLFNKLFFNENGFVQYTKDSTGVEKERYNDGIANLTFTLTDSTGTAVGVTGSNGAYTYSESGGATEMKLDSNGRLYVDKLPTGLYIVRETLNGLWRGENGQTSENPDEAPFTTINVALNEASSLEERIEKAQASDSVGSLSNYYKSDDFKLQITKNSEDGNIENFEFIVTNSEGKVYGPVITDADGIASVEDLPMYKADGVTLETYTLTETRKLPYDELAPIEFTGIPGEDIRYLNPEDGVYNQYTRRNLGIVKRSEDGIVSGIEFTISAIDPDTNKVVETYTVVTEELAKGTYNGSGPIGYGELLGLPVYNAAGTAQLIYEVTENVPLRYEDVHPQQTVLSDELPLTELEFENKVKYTDLYIMKWADDYKVEGLQFMCVGDDGNTYTATSAATGLVTFRNLPV